MTEVSPHTQDMSYAIIDENNPQFANIDDILRTSVKQPRANRSFVMDEFGEPVDGQRVSTSSLGHPAGDLPSVADAESVSHSVENLTTLPNDSGLGAENKGFQDVELADPSAHSISSIDPVDVDSKDTFFCD